MFGLFKKSPTEYVSPEEKAAIVEAIRLAELRTSGEVRIYIEGKCKLVNPVLRAKEVFYQLRMDNTEARNAVLLYVAMKDRQLAVFGDEGIHAKVGYEFWTSEVKTMLELFNKKDYVAGLIKIIYDIGEALVKHFPFDQKTDKNELPDEIVFGK